MRIAKKLRPELITSRDKTRECLTRAELTDHKGSAVLVATDGRRLLVVPVDKEEGDTDGPIPTEALKFSRSAIRDKKTTEVQFSVNGGIKFSNGWTMPRPEQLRFPTWQQVIPEKGKHSISFRAKFLMELATAMGCEDVTISFDGPNTPIYVEPSEGANGRFAVLMPIVNTKP